MSSLSVIESIKESERIGKLYTDEREREIRNDFPEAGGYEPPPGGITESELSYEIRAKLAKIDEKAGYIQLTDGVLYLYSDAYKTRLIGSVVIPSGGPGGGLTESQVQTILANGGYLTENYAKTLFADKSIEDTVASLSEDKVAVSATVADGVATFKNSKGQNLFTMTIPTGGGTVSGMTETQVRDLINTYNFATKGELPASWTEAQIRSIITGYGYGTGTYSKPSTGIPKNDLASAVQKSLDKADTALQNVPDTYATKQWVQEQGYGHGGGMTAEQSEKLEALVDGSVVVNDTRTLSKDNMLSLSDKKLIGDGTVQYDNWMKRGTFELISPVAKVEHWGKPVYMAGKLPSDVQNYWYPDRRNVGYWEANYMPEGYGLAIPIAGLYAQHYPSQTTWQGLPDTFNVFFGKMALFTLSDEPDARWKLHRDALPQKTIGIHVPAESTQEAISLTDQVVDCGDYYKVEVRKEYFNDRYLHWYGYCPDSNPVDCEHTIAMMAIVEIWTDAPEGILFTGLGIDQRITQAGSPKQLNHSRYTFTKNTPEFCICHNISDEIYERQSGTVDDPERVFEEYVRAYRGVGGDAVFPAKEPVNINGQDMVNLGVLSWKDIPNRATHVYVKQIQEQVGGKYVPKLKLAAYYDSKNNDVVINGVETPTSDNDAANKAYVDAHAGGTGSIVSVNTIQTTGTKIAEITVDGSRKDIYAPTPASSGSDFPATSEKDFAGYYAANLGGISFANLEGTSRNAYMTQFAIGTGNDIPALKIQSYYGGNKDCVFRGVAAPQEDSDAVNLKTLNDKVADYATENYVTQAISNAIASVESIANEIREVIG